jgi:hypothetical protein
LEGLENKITLKDLELHAQKHGARKTQRIMSVLGKKSKFIEVIKTEIGQQLLKDVVHRMDELLEKNLKMAITEDERIEYKVLEEISDRWIARIFSYLQKHDQLIKETNNG